MICDQENEHLNSIESNSTWLNLNGISMFLKVAKMTLKLRVQNFYWGFHDSEVRSWFQGFVYMFLGDS